MLFPEEGLVYDYCLDDGGISSIGLDDREEEAVTTGTEVGKHTPFIRFSCSPRKEVVTKERVFL